MWVVEPDRVFDLLQRVLIGTADQQRARLSTLHPFNEGELVIAKGFFSESIVCVNKNKINSYVYQQPIAVSKYCMYVCTVCMYNRNGVLEEQMSVLSRPAQNIDIQIFDGVDGGAATRQREALHIPALCSTNSKYSLLHNTKQNQNTIGREKMFADTTYIHLRYTLEVL